MKKQKQKFVKTDAFHIGVVLAQGTALFTGMLVGASVVEAVVRKAMR